jgi:hypothetical protein
MDCFALLAMTIISVTARNAEEASVARMSEAKSGSLPRIFPDIAALIRATMLAQQKAGDFETE